MAPAVSHEVSEAAEAEGATALRIAPKTVLKATNFFMTAPKKCAMEPISHFEACLVNGPFGLIKAPGTKRGERNAANASSIHCFKMIYLLAAEID
jgi:hypothetical protein